MAAIKLALFMFYYYFLIKRYLGGRGNRLFSINAWLSFLGVFIGSTLLVIVLSVFNGFQEQIRKSIFKFDPHITIEDSKGPGKVKEWRKWRNEITKELGPMVETVNGMIQSPALMRKDERIDHVMIRGMEFPDDAKNKYKYAFPKDFPRITAPKDLKTFPKGNYCIMGRELAYSLDLRIGDYVQLIVPKGQFTATVGIQPGMKAFQISGFFASGNYQYDSRVILLPLASAQTLFEAGDSVQQIAIKLKSFHDLKKALIVLYKKLPYDFDIRSIESEHRNLFAALQWEKVVMTVIVFLFIIAALVGVIVSTANVIRSKRKDIGILKSLGASDQDILIVFTLVGFISGLVGTILGISFGIFLSIKLEKIITAIERIINGVGYFYCQYVSSCSWTRVEFIPPNVYYFDHLPVSIDAALLHPLAIFAIFLSGMAALIPAWVASKMQPVEIIRSSDI